MAIRAPVSQSRWSNGSSPRVEQWSLSKGASSWETASEASTEASFGAESPGVESRSILLPRSSLMVTKVVSPRPGRESLMSKMRQRDWVDCAGPEMGDKVEPQEVSPCVTCHSILSKTNPKIETQSLTEKPREHFVVSHDETQSLANKPSVQLVAQSLLEELPMHGATFDPLQSSTKAILLAKLGLSADATIQVSPDNSGAFNGGVWIVSDAASELVLKLVPHARAPSGRATDAEKFLEMQRQHAQVTSESMITFPCNIFELVARDGSKRNDLIVMRKAAGFQITQHLYFKFHGKHTAQLLDMFKRFGTFLRQLHERYNHMQHGDCQPSNVFYDEISGRFTLIDVADFGYGPYLAEGGENDVEHFISGLKTLSRWYGSRLLAACEKEFRDAYKEAESLQ